MTAARLLRFHTCTDANPVAQRRLPIRAAAVSERHPLVEHQVPARHDVTAHHHADPVHKGESRPDLGTRVDLDAGDPDGTRLEQVSQRSEATLLGPHIDARTSIIARSGG